MRTLKIKTIILLLISCCIGEAQNLIDTSNWTVGSGGTVGFWKNGTDQENSRELGDNHIGNQVIIWRGVPDTAGGSSGGFTTSGYPIDHTQTYRYTIWLKKTNSNDGHSYFGCYDNILNLNGTSNTNPYFWDGDLPQLNKWYLIIGFVHQSNYTGAGNTGGIYDGVTGEKVQTITDYKFAPNATTTRLRSYLYYDSNVDDTQYFLEPRLEPVNGSEHNLPMLMNINTGSKLLFAFDVAGNQKTRLYCQQGGGCPMPSAVEEEEDPILLAAKVSNEEEVSEKEIYEDNTLGDDKKFMIYPNPTEGTVYMNIPTNLASKIETINVYNVNSALIQEIVYNQESRLNFSLQGKPLGVYFLHIHLNDGNSITKKIIKQ